MKFRYFLFALLALMYVGCSHNQNKETQKHENEFAENHDHEATAAIQTNDEHLNKEAAASAGGMEHKAAKINITAYTNSFELFAEADPFVVNEKGNVLAHFSTLPNFSALENGSISITLNINGNKTSQTLDKPTRKGIYSFVVTPKQAGLGTLSFDIQTHNETFNILIPDVEVYADNHDAKARESKIDLPTLNTTTFTKEQSWKIDFATELCKIQPFGQVIKTTAIVQQAQGDEKILTAKMDGIVLFLAKNLLEGKEISENQDLFSVSANGFADNNSAVRYMEARNNYERTKSDYERKLALAENKIVSEGELLNAKNIFDNARIIYNNLNENFNTNGQKVTSPAEGFVKHVFVTNGEFVTAGQPLVSIAQNKKLLLQADVQQKYASILGTVKAAHIHSSVDGKTYSLDELNGEVLSYGKSTNNNNYLIPVYLQIDNNNRRFIPGSFVEVYLKSHTSEQALTIPNSAILEEQGNLFVYVQITPELFEKRQVMPGGTDGLTSEIIAGISPDERVISKGAIMVKLSKAAGTLDAHSGHVH